MNKKIISFVELFLSAICALFLFINGMFDLEYRVKYVGTAGFHFVSEEPTSFFEALSELGTAYEILGYILLALIVTNIVVLLIPMFTENFKNKKWFAYISPIAIVILIFISILGRNTQPIETYWWYKIFPHTLFYIEIFILIVNTFLSLYKNYGKLSNADVE